MRVKIKAGEELDVLNADELRTVMQELASGYLRPPDVSRIEQSIALDDSGDGEGIIYECLIGYTFVLTRCTFVPEGYSFASLYNPATAGGLNLYRGSVDSGDLLDGFPFGGTPATGDTLPVVLTESEVRAIYLRDGDILTLQVVGGPANGNLAVHGHGILQPLLPSI